MRFLPQSKTLPFVLILGSFVTGFFTAPATTEQCTRTYDNCSFRVISQTCSTTRCSDCEVPECCYKECGTGIPDSRYSLCRLG